jgi:pimeloyl-ACP methyl ester carboxylesterase
MPAARPESALPVWVRRDFAPVAAAAVRPRTASRRTKDEPRPEEADTRPARPSGTIQDDQAFLQDIGEPVLADQHEQGGADTHQDMSPQAGVLLADLPLQADGPGQQQREPRFAGLELASDFGQVTLPVLFVHGSDDPVVPAAHAREWAARLKRARLAEFPGARHDILNETVHRDVAAAITEFVLTAG